MISSQKSTSKTLLSRKRSPLLRSISPPFLLSSSFPILPLRCVSSMEHSFFLLCFSSCACLQAKPSDMSVRAPISAPTSPTPPWSKTAPISIAFSRNRRRVSPSSSSSLTGDAFRFFSVVLFLVFPLFLFRKFNS